MEDQEYQNLSSVGEFRYTDQKEPYMKTLTKKQIKALRDEFLTRITNRTAFSLDMANFANELQILQLKYGDFAVYIAIKEAYKAWGLERMDEQVDEELDRLVPKPKGKKGVLGL